MNRGLAGQRDDAKALLCASCTLLLGCHRNEERASLGSLECLHSPGLLHMFRRLLHPLPSLTPESAVSNALPSRGGSPSGRRRKPVSCQSRELRTSCGGAGRGAVQVGQGCCAHRDPGLMQSWGTCPADPHLQSACWCGSGEALPLRLACTSERLPLAVHSRRCAFP